MSARIIPRLADDSEIFAWVEDSLAEGRRRGVFADIRHALNGKESCAVIGADNSTTAGFATFHAPYEEHRFIWLDLLWVEPAFRRRGLASQLIAAIVEDAGSAPFKLGFGTFVGNAPMNALAARCGFAPWATHYQLEVGA